ncbi:unnamed protein product [Coregonus sp. 'balchen']|nr:unnamed protein product [Coregonus sp. 'balchen']
MVASVGCYIKSCQRKVHFPSYCKDHSPTQSLPVSASVNEPMSCSVCLDPIEPVLSYSILKCPACHGSWFHRDCVQNQAHSAAMFFFRCTLCNNKDMFQQEMLRMGVHIPERDASWELEENAYGELLQVYQHCDAKKCLSHNGRTCSSRTGWFQILRCALCGSSGTHRKCASLKLDETNWACEDCAAAVDGTASLARHTDSPQPGGQRRSRSSKRSLTLTPRQSPIVCKRPFLLGGSAREILQELASQTSQHQLSMPVVVNGNKVLEAAMELVKRSDFNPSHALAVRFTSSKHNSSPDTCPGNTRHFLRLLVQQLQNTVFEGPDGAKTLTLNARVGRCATSLEDVLIFATSADVVPAVGFRPSPTLSFLHPLDPAGAFPMSQPSSNRLLLPVVPSYQAFKKHMEYAVCQLTVLQSI